MTTHHSIQICSSRIPQGNAGVRMIVWMSALVLAVLAGSQTASASCGDYLFRNGVRVSHNAMRSTNVGSAHLQNVNVDDQVNVPVPAPVHRCTGPNCSSTPTPFAPVPSAPVNEVPGQDMATLLAGVSLNGNRESLQELPGSDGVAIFVPGKIFRPPEA